MVSKIKADWKAKPWYYDAVLTAQGSGVPCRSSLFHTKYRDEFEWNVKLYEPDTMETKSCYKDCKRGG